MKLDPNTGVTRPFAQANFDSLNPGVKDRHRDRLPPGYHPMWTTICFQTLKNNLPWP